MEDELAHHAISRGIYLGETDNSIRPGDNSAIGCSKCTIVEHVGACGEAINADEVPGALHGMVSLG